MPRFVDLRTDTALNALLDEFSDGTVVYWYRAQFVEPPIPLIEIMRTNIVIDDKLMKETLRLTGLRTKREAVELGLRTIVRLRKQEEIRRFRGKLKWQGDLDAMRTD